MSFVVPASMPRRQRGSLSLLAACLASTLVVSACSSTTKGEARPAARHAGALAYVTNNIDNSISVIDVETAREVTSVPIPRIGARYAYPAFITATADGRKLYVANLNTSSLSVVDTADNTILKRIDLDHPPREMAFSPDGRKLYVAGDGEVAYVIDPSSDTLLTRLPIGDSSSDVALSPDGRRAYFTTAAGTVAVVDTSTDTVSNSIVDLRGAAAIVLDPTGTTAYVLRNDHPGRVYFVDLASGAVTAETQVEDSPIAAALSPDGRHLYVLNRGSDTLSIIDTAARKLEASMPAGSAPGALALSRDGKRLFVAATGSNALYILSPESRSLLAKVKIERAAAPRPMGVAVVEP